MGRRNTITFNTDMLILLNELTNTHFFALCVRLALHLEDNSWQIKIDKFSVRELSKQFGSSINKINSLIKLAIELGVIIKFETAVINMFLFNPNIAYKGKMPEANSSILKMFNLTILQRYTYEQLKNYLSIPATSNHNIYILSQKINDDKSIYKIGYSKNIDVRIRNYFTTNPTAKLIATFYFENALKIERSLHMNEWYDLETMKQINKDYSFGLHLWTFNNNLFINFSLTFFIWKLIERFITLYY